MADKPRRMVPLPQVSQDPDMKRMERIATRNGETIDSIIRDVDGLLEYAEQLRTQGPDLLKGQLADYYRTAKNLIGDVPLQNRTPIWGKLQEDVTSTSYTVNGVSSSTYKSTFKFWMSDGSSNFVEIPGVDDIIDPHGWFKNLKTGAIVQVGYETARNRYIIIAADPGSGSGLHRIQLTADMNATTVGKAKAKFYLWNGSAYAQSGDEFDIYDLGLCYGQALTGDTGTVYRDAERDVWAVNKLDSPFDRWVTLGSALQRDTHVSATDLFDNTVTISAVYGFKVAPTKQIPVTARVSIRWYPNANPFAIDGSGTDGNYGCWIADGWDICLERVT